MSAFHVHRRLQDSIYIFFLLIFQLLVSNKHHRWGKKKKFNTYDRDYSKKPGHWDRKPKKTPRPKIKINVTCWINFLSKTTVIKQAESKWTKKAMSPRNFHITAKNIEFYPFFSDAGKINGEKWEKTNKKVKPKNPW